MVKRVGLRVHELARSLSMSTRSVLARLNELGVPARSASSFVDSATATRVNESFGQYGVATEAGAATPRQSTWNAIAVKSSTYLDTLRNPQRLKQAFPAVEDHHVILARFGFAIPLLGDWPRVKF
ncbi:translation initiation factor IF-2 N-terminal domain-containing protein [Saccharopolyspora sp. NPDC000995]